MTPTKQREYPITVTVEKVTLHELMAHAYSFTAGRVINPSVKNAYKWKHSPWRTQMFVVEMFLPSYASVHFVRHKVWCEHFVKTNREDRGGDKEANRHTMVGHMMFLNAEALASMSHKRLCSAADATVQKVMRMIQDGVRAVDPDLADVMMPLCGYRGGICEEPRCCGRNKQYVPVHEATSAELDVLREALTALNTARKFTVGDTDSYAIAAKIDKLLTRGE